MADNRPVRFILIDYTHKMKPISPSHFPNKSQLTNELASADGKVSLIGAVTLADVKMITRLEYDVIDLSLAVFGEDIETYYVGMGKYTSSKRHRSVDVLTKLLEDLDALEVILPDNVGKRHMNAISKSIRIYSVRVLDTCKLYAMQGNEVYNKKKTILVFSPRPLDLRKCACCGKDIPYNRIYHIPYGERTGSRFLYNSIGDELVCKHCFNSYYEPCQYCQNYYRREIMKPMYNQIGICIGYYCPSCGKEYEGE